MWYWKKIAACSYEYVDYPELCLTKLFTHLFTVNWIYIIANSYHPQNVIEEISIPIGDSIPNILSTEAIFESETKDYYSLLTLNTLDNIYFPATPKQKII